MTRNFAFTLFALVALSFCVGFLVGCGDITATMVEPPPAAAAPDADMIRVDTGRAASEGGPPSVTTGPPAGEPKGETEQEAGAAGGGPPTDAGAAELGAPEHPALHCQGASGDYRLTVCKPGCGTCQKIGEASTFAAGCWTSDDFHCVDSCGECR